MSDVVTKPALNADGEQIFQQPIVARALRNTFHFWKFFLMGLLVFGFGGLAFLFDGFYRYPKYNRQIDELEAEIAKKEAVPTKDRDANFDLDLAKAKTQLKDLGHKSTDTSLWAQIAIGSVCTPLGLWMLWRHLRATSGRYLLENNTLSLPHHPPIPIESVSAIRNAKWMTKGLANFDYQMSDGKVGTFTLDALAFESKPADAIHDEIVRNLRLRTGADVKTAKELKKD